MPPSRRSRSRRGALAAFRASRSASATTLRLRFSEIPSDCYKEIDIEFPDSRTAKAASDFIRGDKNHNAGLSDVVRALWHSLGFLVEDVRGEPFDVLMAAKVSTAVIAIKAFGNDICYREAPRPWDSKYIQAFMDSILAFADFGAKFLEQLLAGKGPAFDSIRPAIALAAKPASSLQVLLYSKMAERDDYTGKAIVAAHILTGKTDLSGLAGESDVLVHVSGSGTATKLSLGLALLWRLCRPQDFREDGSLRGVIFSAFAAAQLPTTADIEAAGGNAFSALVSKLGFSRFAGRDVEDVVLAFATTSDSTVRAALEHWLLVYAIINKKQHPTLARNIAHTFHSTNFDLPWSEEASSELIMSKREALLIKIMPPSPE